MNTVEMWLKAQEDGYVYECPKCEMLYSRDTGLINNDSYNDTIYMEEFDTCTLDDLMSFEWKKIDNFMTIKEAEEKYGIKIICNNT